MNKFELEKILITSIRTKNYKNAIFYASELIHLSKAHRLIYPIILFLQKNYYYCENILKNERDMPTKYFYLGMIYKNLKRYEIALVYFKKLQISKTFTYPRTIDPFFYRFYFTKDLLPFLEELVAQCYIRQQHMQMYYCNANAFNSFNSLSAFEMLADNNFKFEKDGKISLPFFSDYLSYIENENCIILKKYEEKDEFFSRYFFHLIGKYFYDKREFLMALKFFPNRQWDIHLVNIYSSILLSLNKKREIEALSNFLLAYYKNDYRTWLVLANAYSVNSDHMRALVCVRRSLYILETFYGYLNLGYEFVEIKEFKKAIKYFFVAMNIYNSNYNSYFSIAQLYNNDTYDRKTVVHSEDINVFFNQALNYNRKNKLIKFVYLKYLLMKKQFKEAINFFLNIYAIDDILMIRKYFSDKSMSDVDKRIIKLIFKYLCAESSTYDWTEMELRREHNF